MLDLQSNQLSEDASEYLSHIIFDNHGLNELLLNNNNIGKGVLHIAKALQNVTSLMRNHDGSMFACKIAIIVWVSH